MLLSYIDFMLEEGVVDVSTYDIYKTLIEKWLIREAEKRKFTGDRANFIHNLREASKAIALRIYENWKVNGID